MEPVVEGEVFVDAPEHHHGGVRVHVDEAREYSLSAAVQLFGTRDFQWLGRYFCDARAVYQQVDGLALVLYSL